MKLKYANPPNAQYNGNIASMQWTTKLYGVNTYNFDYDGANRITEAIFSGMGNYTTTYLYHKNSNISNLTRQGKFGASNNYGIIEDLVYAYSSNQLIRVNDNYYYDNQNNGFSDNGSFSGIEYQYDANGNMLSDLNKRIDTIYYNHLNLPQQINISTDGNNEINYLYTANGQKLMK